VQLFNRLDAAQREPAKQMPAGNNLQRPVLLVHGVEADPDGAHFGVAVLVERHNVPAAVDRICRALAVQLRCVDLRPWPEAELNHLDNNGVGRQRPHPVGVRRQQLVHVGDPLAVDTRGFLAVDLVHALAEVREAAPREEARKDDEAAAVKHRLLPCPEAHPRVHERLQRARQRHAARRERVRPARWRRGARHGVVRGSPPRALPCHHSKVSCRRANTHDADDARSASGGL